MRRSVLVLAAALPFAVSARAHANVFELYAQVEGGGSLGTGVGGAQQDNDFFGHAQGGLYGAKIGGEVLFTDVWVEHWQLSDGALVGTWTQFMAGVDVDFALGDTPKGQRPKTFAELGFGFGFGLATGQQVEPPLDNGELSDKGFIGQVSLGIDYRMSGIMSIGVSLPVTYGYMFKADVPANDTSNHYHQLAAAPQLYLRLRVGK
jgi:hypothetical protein